ncbi:serine/threonine-protein kinase TOR [Vigna angularis]|uniref:serine/threonine-protein kinase TOR n=1 Tax=Phaseolus angularis TaxID=3914 RepID=UPI000809A29E|nr:serine/threonine-protein kinase TOR [Vigna angularis]
MQNLLIKHQQYDPENVRYHGHPQVMLANLKYQWSLEEDSKRREACIRLQNLAMELSSQPVTPSSFTSGLNPSVPLLARVYLNLGSWQWSLSPFNGGKHKWALFNPAVMSHYTP